VEGCILCSRESTRALTEINIKYNSRESIPLCEEHLAFVVSHFGIKSMQAIKERKIIEKMLDSKIINLDTKYYFEYKVMVSAIFIDNEFVSFKDRDKLDVQRY
jgi:hypothetical protein